MLSTECGWLSLIFPIPDEAELQEVFGAPPAKPTPSKLEPYKDKVADWFNQGITGTTIHKALVRNYGFDGSYSSVRRYLEILKNQSPKATVKLVFKPGESAQVDLGQKILALKGGRELLGHTQIKTTMRYAHLANETLLEAVNTVLMDK